MSFDINNLYLRQMKLKAKIFIVINLLILAISIMFWIDVITQEQIIYSQDETNTLAVCKDNYVFIENLVSYLINEKEITINDFKLFFRNDGGSYIETIAEDDFEFQSSLYQIKEVGLDVNDYDCVLQLQNQRIFFLFNDSIFVQTIICPLMIPTNYNSIVQEYYLEIK